MSNLASSTPAQSKEVHATIRPSEPVNIVGIRIGYVLGGSGWLACYVVASQVGGETWLNVLICLFGSTIGWWAGILISPDPAEQGQFVGVRKAVSVFLSGFILAKLDVLFQGAVARNLANSPIFIGRIFLFATTCMICAQFTYVARHNLRVQPSASPPAMNVAGATSISLGQRLLRITGILALVGALSLLYIHYLPSLNIGRSVIVILIAASAIMFLGSTNTARDWLLGKNDAIKESSQ
jgi:hypothetical protein